MLFSQRKGLKPVRTVVQVDSIDHDLRTGLWNVLSLNYWARGEAAGFIHFDTTIEALIHRLWHFYFKKPLDTLNQSWIPTYQQLREYFFKAEWFEVYDFVEFVANNFDDESVNKRFVETANAMLEQELSAYRFVGLQITQITSEIEIESIESALQVSDRLRPVNTHLRSALDKLSDRMNPDYRNSIKESISAVEALCNLIAGTKSSLGDALNKVEERLSMHGALKKAFSSLYGYTSDTSGIRHALLDESNLDFEDAKFMLVSCSGFVTYLVSKANKAGISVQ